MLNIFKFNLKTPNFKLIELENVCRICLHSATNMLSLFNNEIDSVISEFLPQKLQRKPLQPHQICAKCFKEARTAYIFKKQCQYSDELIKSMLNEPNISKTYEKQTQTDTSNFILYPCEICEKKFESLEISRAHHLKEHNTSNIYETSDKVFTKNSPLKNNLISDPKLHKCQLCEKKFTRKFMLKRHLFDEHNINEYFLKEAINLEKDGSIFDKLDKYEFKCESCLETFEVEDALNHECTTFLYKKTLEEENSSEESQSNDCDMNKIKVVPVSEQNNDCDSVFEDNLEIDEEHKEETFEKYEDEIFITEFEINNETIFAEELKVSKEIVGFVKSEPKEFSCKYCSEKVIGKLEYQRHYKGHFTEFERAKPFLCSECGASFAKSNNLNVHIRRHRGEKPFKCGYCDKAFPRTTDKYLHERIHTGEKSYRCTVCSKTYQRNSRLQVHMRTHTGERPYKCSYCPMAFTEQPSLRLHHRRHTGERSYCDLCSLNFSTPQILLNHKRKAHDVDKTKEFSCKHCSEIIVGAIEYQKHCKVHHTAPAKPHICAECGMNFKTSENLRTHIRKHTGEKPYKCEYCDKAFAALTNLYRHRKSHTGMKNYHCTNCTKTFVSPSELKRHIRKHTGERPYKCSYCPMAFTENRSLKKHRMKHTGE